MMIRSCWIRRFTLFHLELSKGVRRTHVNIGTNTNNEAARNGDMDASVSYSPIQNFFSGRCVLVTGATGFVGKALVEKLLRSCPELRTIYLLIRPKRGRDVQTRHKEFIQDPVSTTIFLHSFSAKGCEIDGKPSNIHLPSYFYIFYHSQYFPPPYTTK
jgi:hypothetical protein